MFDVSPIAHAVDIGHVCCEHKMTDSIHAIIVVREFRVAFLVINTTMQSILRINKVRTHKINNRLKENKNLIQKMLT